MILEHAILSVKNGQEESFERDFSIAGQYISSIKGYIKHTLSRCLEQKSTYLLLVEWEHLEDHTVGFDDLLSIWSGKIFCTIIMSLFQ